MGMPNPGNTGGRPIPSAILRFVDQAPAPLQKGVRDFCYQSAVTKVDTEYDRANVPPYNGNDPPPAPGSLKRSLFPTLLNEVQNKGTQGVRARYGAELPPIISIVRRCPVPRSSSHIGPRQRGWRSRGRRILPQNPSFLKKGQNGALSLP